jgi:hypothetical protein
MAGVARARQAWLRQVKADRKLGDYYAMRSPGPEERVQVGRGWSTLVAVGSNLETAARLEAEVCGVQWDTVECSRRQSKLVAPSPSESH